MTNPAVIDGARLLSWARRAAQELESHREEINSLNVFPVPDSDTGSNMAHTMAAAVKQAETLDDGAGAAEIASALSVGSIKGARGNSGVVLSQVLRGVAQAAAEGDLDGRSVADALNHAVAYVERAINEPVEGTIVTVLREAAAAGTQVLDERAGEVRDASEPVLAAVAVAAVTAAEEALERTPSQLAELREAGVVDAGGRGLVLLLTVLRDEVVGQQGVAGSEIARPVTAENSSLEADSHGHGGWLEVMFMFSGPVDELELALASMGTSLVIARASDTDAKVHIHSRDAGAVIERAFSLGAVSELRLEILPDDEHDQQPAAPARLVIAVSPPGAVADLYRRAGALPIAPGEDLAEQIGERISAAGADELIVLPNGHVGPQQLQELSHVLHDSGAAVAVLSTERLVGGIAALAVHDPRLPLEDAAAQMDEAASDMRAADIVKAEDRTLVLPPDGVLLANEESVHDAVDKACRSMLAGGGELVTLLIDSDVAAGLDADALEEALGVELLIYPADGLGALGQIGVE